MTNMIIAPFQTNVSSSLVSGNCIFMTSSVQKFLKLNMNHYNQVFFKCFKCAFIFFFNRISYGRWTTAGILIEYVHLHSVLFWTDFNEALQVIFNILCINTSQFYSFKFACVTNMRNSICYNIDCIHFQFGPQISCSNSFLNHCQPMTQQILKTDQNCREAHLS